MFIISQKKNLDRPDVIRKNKPEYIDEALSSGFDIEADVRFVNKLLFLGHDKAQYFVNSSWLNKIKKKNLLICKSKQAAENSQDFNSFCHV
jgi:hypothetical protein